MYEVSIRRTFRADHAITIEGRRESTHGHEWTVVVHVTGARLDDEGILLDFHGLETSLEAVLDPLRERDLGTLPIFDGIEPTAEHVARHVAESISTGLAEGLRIARVSVTESPGCVASWVPSL